MRITFLILFLVLSLLPSTKLKADGGLGSLLEPVEKGWSLFWDDPILREENEILKRVEERNEEEIRKLRVQIKTLLRDTSGEPLPLSSPKEKERLKSELQNFPNLGGLLIKQNSETLFQMGDFSDFYEDGLSRDKIRLEGQIPTFAIHDKTCYFFIRNEPGYIPIEPNFIGYETLFYVFGDEGSLRYTNDFRMDQSIRLGEFRKTFDSFKQNFPEVELKTANDLTIFFVPGKTRPLYYILTTLKLFLLFWCLLLVTSLIRMAYPSHKKSIA